MQQRRLAAIMFTDIVGYTAMMSADEKLTLKSIEQNKQIHLTYFKKHNGSLIKELGDGILSSFESSVEAVNCAIEIQRQIREKASFQVRIGIHQGDILFKDEDIFGDGVNIASRLEPLAAPGGICVTGEIAEVIRSSGIKVVSLGEKELKNAGNKKVWAIAEDDLAIPPKFEKHKPTEIPNNLPNPSTSFIGRKNELKKIAELASNHRLISVIGAGGSGKTRFALETGNLLLSDFPDGIWFVDLGMVNNQQVVMQLISHVLQVKEEIDRDQKVAIAEAIADKNLLIILDNCEHVIEATANFATHILKYTNNPKILATSREVLNIHGEHVWFLPQLSYPIDEVNDIAVAQSYESIGLFCDRASSANANFELNEENLNSVGEVCRQLEGLPLALELAAARVNVLDPDIILERLNNRFQLLKSHTRDSIPRQQTISATIAWSFDLLSEQEKILLTRLSVFSGGFSLPVAEEICAYEQLEKSDVLDLLEQLVNKSLVIPIKTGNGQGRFRLLEIIRQYAQSELESENGKPAVVDRFYHYYIQLAKSAYKNQFKEADKWIGVLSTEHANIMAALDHMSDRIEAKLELAGYLAWYWFVSSQFLLSHEYLKKPLESFKKNNEIKARALFGHGWVTWWISPIEGLKYFKKAVEAYMEIKNTFEYPLSLISYGIVQNMLDHTKGHEEAKKGLEIAESTNDEHLIVYCKSFYYYLYVTAADPDQAAYVEPLSEANMIAAERLGMSYYTYFNHHTMCDCSLIMGHGIVAEKRYIEVLQFFTTTSNLFQIAAIVFMLSMGLALQGRHTKSFRLYYAGLKKLAEIKVDILQVHFVKVLHERIMMPLFSKLVREELERYKSEGQSMTWKKVLDYAMDSETD